MMAFMLLGMGERTTEVSLREETRELNIYVELTKKMKENN